MEGLKTLHSLITRWIVGLFIFATFTSAHAVPKVGTFTTLPAGHTALLDTNSTTRGISRLIYLKEIIENLTEEESEMRVKRSSRMHVGTVFGLLGAAALLSSYFAWRHERKKKASRKARHRLRKLWKHSIRRKKNSMPVKSSGPEHGSTNMSIDREYFCRERETTNRLMLDGSDFNDNRRLGSPRTGTFGPYVGKTSPGIRRDAVQTV